MNRYFIVALVLLCVFVFSVRAQGRFGRSPGDSNGRGRQWRRGFRRNQNTAGDADNDDGSARRLRRPNWRNRAAYRRRWMSLKNTWNVALPGGGLAEEVAFLRTASGDVSFRAMQNIMWMMSRSDSLKAANFQKAFTMIDFNSGLLGVRVELPDDLVEPESNDWRQKRRYWRNKNHACFISDVEYNILDAAAELNTRNSSETAVPLGSEKVMYAQFVNAISVDDIMGSPIGRLCGRAARDNKAFRLVSTDDGLQYSSSTYTVLGHIDVQQPGKSVPMKIFVDTSIDLDGDAGPLPQ